MIRPRIPALGLLVAVAAASGAWANASSPASRAGGPYRNGLIAFVRCCGPPTGIVVIRQDGTGERTIFKPAGDDVPLNPAWSPDGRRIAFVPGPPEGGVWVMSATGGKRRRVTAGTGAAGFPSWSPRGTAIVFSDARRAGARFYELYVVRTDGSGLRRLTSTGPDENQPAWAPNGREIVYGRGRDIWRMRADGTRQRLFLRNAFSPSWSPAGTHLAFIRDGDPWIVSRDGTGAKRVLDFPKWQTAIAWSPDGRWLVTAPAERGDLTLVRTDGSDVAGLTNRRGYGQSWPSWQRLPG